VDGASVLQLAQQPLTQVSTTNQCFCVTCIAPIIAMLGTHIGPTLQTSGASTAL